MTPLPPKRRNPLLTVPVKYGLVGAFLTLVLFFTMLFFDKNPLVTNKWFDLLLLPMLIFFSIKEYKQYYNHGILHFWQGMTVGFFTYFCIAMITALFLWSYLTVVSPDLVQDYITNRSDLILNSKESFIAQFGEESYRKTLADIKLVTAFDLALDDLLKKSFVGLFATSLISIIMRRLPVAEKQDDASNKEGMVNQ